MSRYGIDYYGEGYYGSDNPISFSVYPFTAVPSNHGSILLNWADPKGNWSSLVLVRNTYGFPIDVSDGVTVLSAYNGSDPVFFQDTGLVQGVFYYYTIFVYNLTQYAWVNAGTAFAVSVKDLGNTNKLYNYLPEIYKIQYPYSPSSDWDNPVLYGFLSNFGFELDYEQTMTDLLSNRYNAEKVSGSLIPALMNQFGQTYEPALGLQQNRIILRDGVTLTKQKGSKEGLLGFIKDFSGWGVPIPVSGTPNPSVNGILTGHNLMLDYNDSSFEESSGHWVSTDGTADVDQLGVIQILTVSITSNVATLTFSTKYNQQYDVGNYVLISGLPYPLFNSSSPYMLTAVTPTSISFALTSSNFSSSTGYNLTTSAYGLITPYPSPWVEPTAPTLFPNKVNGILAAYNNSASTQTISTYAGDDSAINNGIPVTAGTTYCFSIYAAKGSGATARTITAKIKWFNRFGVYLSTSSGTGVSDNTALFSSSYRPYVSAAAPTNAAYACPGVSIASIGGSATNEHHYFDAAQFESASTPSSFDEARQIHITIRANRINEFINPNFATAITPWTVTGSATATTDSTIVQPNVTVYTVSSTYITSNVATVNLTTPHNLQVGSSVTLSNITGSGVTSANYNGARTITAVSLNSFSFAVTATNQGSSGSPTTTTGSAWQTGHMMKLTGSGTTAVVAKSWDGSTNSQMINIYYPNTSYTFSSYIKTSITTEAIILKINWYDMSYTLISSSTGLATSITASSWGRPYVTGTAPATAAYATAEIDWSTVSSGDIIYLDQILFENNGQVLDYFDGSNGLGDYRNFIWEGGVANGSRSHYYKNSFVTQTRLFGAILTAELPLGSTAAVYIAQPQT